MTSTQRVVVVTGASSGLGKATAKALAAQGWRVIALGRDPQRCAAARAEIGQAATVGAIDMIRADLGLMAEAARAAQEVAALTDRVDVLINNAGAIGTAQVITADGHEQTFATDYLGPFLFTMRLLPLLRRAAADAPPGSVRILMTSSGVSWTVPGLDWDDLQMLRDFEPLAAYSRAKLANILFTCGLAKRLAGDGIVAHAMNPGAVETNFFNQVEGGPRAALAGFDVLTPEEGADTLVWLATAEEAGRTSGEFFFKRKARRAHPFVNDASVERMWIESEKLLAIPGA